MQIDRFKKIIRYSKNNRDGMEAKIRDFYAHVGMNADKEFLNLMQIARPLFEKKGYIIVELPFKDKEIGALCYKGDALGYTFLNTSLPKVNVNFALSHELYHVFCQTRDFKDKVELYINSAYLEDEDELAANLFAGMLLMPAQSFEMMFRKFQNEKKDDDNNITVLAKLMSYFETPYMATLLRCYELDLMPAGDLLELLINVEASVVRDEFVRLWLDESILDATLKDDYCGFEKLVKVFGERYQAEEYLSSRTVEKVLQNMRVLYGKIKGD